MTIALVAHSGGDHVVLAALATALVLLYGLAVLRVPAWPQRRFVAWGAGVLTVLVASLPVMERVAARSFTGHMVQHLLVIVLAAPLLVASHPFHLLQRTGWLPNIAIVRAISSAWRRHGALVAPFAFIIVLFTTHLTSIYDDALHNRLLHETEHAGYLLVAVALWSAVLGVGRSTAIARIGAVFAVGVGGSLLAMILLSADEPLMPTYEARLGAAEAVSDQHSAAALMWVSGMLTTVPLLVVALWRWAAREDRLTRQAEELLDQQAASRVSG